MREHSRSCLDWLEIGFYWLSAFFKSNVLKGCSPRYFFLWVSWLNQRHELGRSSVPASHCEHATNLVNQIVNKNVIGVVDVHKCVSISMSMGSLVNTVCGYVIGSAIRNKSADCKNISGFLVFLLESHFKKRIASTINVMCLWNWAGVLLWVQTVLIMDG